MTMSYMRIVLLGKTGSGKSSLANTILGESVFGIHHTAESGTKVCQTERRDVHGRIITLTDTPGFFDSKKSDKKLKPAIIKCITDCSPGPHAFLIQLEVDRFTDQENEIISKIKKYFSEEAFKHAVVVFTHGDDLDDGMKIEEFVGQNKKLRDLLEKCGGRCHVVDNKYWNNQQDEYRNNQVQVEALLNTIDRMIQANGGGYYTNEMLQEVDGIIQKVLRLLSQFVKNKIDIIIFRIFNQTQAHHDGDVLLRALLGEPEMIATVAADLQRVGVTSEVDRAVRLTTEANV